MPQVELRGVDILPTRRCTSRCRHCSYMSSPKAVGEMTAKEVERYVSEASRFGIEWIWVGGGEPFLCRDILLHIADTAKRADVPDVYVVTNSCWACSPETAATELALLNKAGVTILGVSIDAFHQEYISLDYVRNVLRAAQKSGFKRIEVSGQFLASVDFAIDFNAITERNLRALEREGYLDAVKVNREVLRLCGRAAYLLASYLPARKEDELISAKCDPKWLPVESLDKLRAVEIDWQGNVTTCPGICIGNASKTSLQEILESYDYFEHPIIKTLVDEGPHCLLQEAKSSGYVPLKEGYADGCHMCFDVRKFLMHSYPTHLRPATCYME